MKASLKNTVSYTLRSKDIPLISFSLYEYEEEEFGVTDKVYSIHVDKVYNENFALFPKKLSAVTDKNLRKWITARKTPENRQYAEKILAASGDSHNPMDYVDVSHALSLTDTYWITRDDSDHKWKDYNLYDNPFDKNLSVAAFTGVVVKISGIVNSPEFTTGGALKKYWDDREDGIYLIKGDGFSPSPDGRSQAANEYYAAQVAETMGFEHVKYDLEEFHHQDGSSEIVCKCRLFTSESEGFVDAETFYENSGLDICSDPLNTLKLQKQMAELYGYDKYVDMMLFDSLIANRDRHLGNFGMIVDNNTGEYLRPAPIFDNGWSMFYGAAANDLKKEALEDYSKTIRCKFFALDTQAGIFVQQRHLPNLHKLVHFEFKKHPKYNISDETLSAMSEFIRQRALRTIELFHRKTPGIFESDLPPFF